MCTAHTTDDNDNRRVSVRVLPAIPRYIIPTARAVAVAIAIAIALARDHRSDHTCANHPVDAHQTGCAHAGPIHCLGLLTASPFGSFDHKQELISSLQHVSQSHGRNVRPSFDRRRVTSHRKQLTGDNYGLTPDAARRRLTQQCCSHRRSTRSTQHTAANRASLGVLFIRRSITRKLRPLTVDAQRRSAEDPGRRCSLDRCSCVPLLQRDLSFGPCSDGSPNTFFGLSGIVGNELDEGHAHDLL